MGEDHSDKSSVPSSAHKAGISRRRLLGSTSAIAVSAAAAAALPRTAKSETSSILPRPEPPFQGKIERTLKGSVPDFQILLFPTLTGRCGRLGRLDP